MALIRDVFGMLAVFLLLMAVLAVALLFAAILVRIGHETGLARLLEAYGNLLHLIAGDAR